MGRHKWQFHGVFGIALGQGIHSIKHIERQTWNLSRLRRAHRLLRRRPKAAVPQPVPVVFSYPVQSEAGLLGHFRILRCLW